MPDAAEVEAILRRTLEPFRIDEANWVELAHQGAGLSCAELVRACQDAAKDAVLEDRDRLASKDTLPVTLWFLDKGKAKTDGKLEEL